MARNTSGYKRLPGRGSTLAGYHRMWLGDDHVLLVKSGTMNETYRRFFFADIQAITLRRTDFGKYLNGAFGFMFFVFALIALQVSGAGGIALWCLAAPFLLMLVTNLAQGPTCATYIKTAVQNERIHALGRVRTANKFRDHVRPLISATQASLTEPPPPPPATSPLEMPAELQTVPPPA